MLAEVLQKGDIFTFGRLMNVSHDGDRVSNFSPETARLKRSLCTDVPLYLQPGDYSSSTPEIDRMVDVALRAGSLGAQINGAGLGGSIMALVEEERSSALLEAMRKNYFEPSGVTANFIRAVPVGGAGIL